MKFCALFVSTFALRASAIDLETVAQISAKADISTEAKVEATADSKAETTTKTNTKSTSKQGEEFEGPGQAGVGDPNPYPDYFENPNHVENDYSLPSNNDDLPGPDFNRKVYQFDETKQIWNQHNY